MDQLPLQITHELPAELEEIAAADAAAPAVPVCPPAVPTGPPRDATGANVGPNSTGTKGLLMEDVGLAPRPLFPAAPLIAVVHYH